MGKLAADRSSDLLLRLLRPAVESWMSRVARRVERVDPRVDFGRREPFLLLANHSFAMDVVHVPLPFRITPQIVASRDMFVNPVERFVLTWVARCIKATKGGGDLRTVTDMMRAVDAGYPVLVFPHGDIPFYGETGPLPRSAAMLAHKLGLDVITCRVSGGYLSSPRWARSPRANRRIQLEYGLALPGTELRSMPLRDIHAALEARLSHNDYEYQRVAMESRPSDAPAEGLEDILYACPACGGLLGIEAKGEGLRCRHCGAAGRLDEYGFLSGFPVDNLADWDRLQRRRDGELRAATFSTGGFLFLNDYRRLRQRKIGRVGVTHRAGVLELSGAAEAAFPVAELRDVVMTGRADLNFSAGDRDYIVRLDGPTVPFLRACQDRY